MKKLALILLVVASMFSGVACTAQDKKAETVKKGDKVEVYYFHFTRRCMTCNAVEDESKKALEALYPKQMKSGKVIFKSVNLDEDSSKAIADKCDAAGQALLVISGAKRVDLTSVGFMNARSNPDKLKQEIKSAIDPMLK